MLTNYKELHNQQGTCNQIPPRSRDKLPQVIAEDPSTSITKPTQEALDLGHSKTERLISSKIKMYNNSEIRSWDN